MLTIDWGDLRPSKAERSEIETRLAAIDLDGTSTVSLLRCDSGCEATLCLALQEGTTEVRLQGADAGAALRRLFVLIEVVASERRQVADRAQTCIQR